MHTGMCRCDMTREARGRRRGSFQWERALGVSITRGTAAFPAAQPVCSEQLQTPFARSSAVLNVLWQHLLEQGENAQCPGMSGCICSSHHSRRLPSSGGLRQGSVTSTVSTSGPARMPLPALCCRFFLSTLPSRARTLLCHPELSGWQSNGKRSLTTGFSVGSFQKSPLRDHPATWPARTAQL